MKPRLIDCTAAQHAEQILAILNHAITQTTALYEYRTRPLSSMADWFALKSANHLPVIGIETDHGKLMGFASYARFRPYAAFKYSVEHSVYVHPAHQGCGLGTMLLKALIERARQGNIHVMVGGIDAGNQASIQLHTALGFAHAGTIREAGFKFGRWLDLAFYQLRLDTPSQPVDG